MLSQKWESQITLLSEEIIVVSCNHLASWIKLEIEQFVYRNSEAVKLSHVNTFMMLLKFEI